MKNEKTKNIIFFGAFCVLMIILIVVAIGYKEQSKQKKSSLSELEEIVNTVGKENLVNYSGLLPKENYSFSKGLGTESYYQVKEMKTSSGNKFFVPISFRDEDIIVDLNDHRNELESFMGVNVGTWLVKTISLFPIKVDLPLIINIYFSKWLEELDNINDGTHLSQKKVAEQIPVEYAVCWEIYPLPVEFSDITTSKIKFYDQGLICSNKLQRDRSEVLSFGILWNQDSYNKLMMIKNYYLPVELLSQVNNKKDFNFLLEQNKIIPISGSVMGVFY